MTWWPLPPRQYTHASNVTFAVAVVTTERLTLSSTPSKPAAVSVSVVSAPVCPSATPPAQVPGSALPDASAAVVPEASPSRQYRSGACWITSPP